MPISFSAFGVSGMRFIKGFLLYSPHFLPVICLASAIDVLLYELSPNLITGVLMQFLTMIALSYASGVFYTVQTMPGILKRISSILPTGHALRYLQLSARQLPASAGHLAWIAAWTAALLFLAVLLRLRKLTSKGGA